MSAYPALLLAPLRDRTDGNAKKEETRVREEFAVFPEYAGIRVSDKSGPEDPVAD